MEETASVRLDLRAPLEYDEIEADREFFDRTAAQYTGELVFLFELNPEQTRSFEPDDARFLGGLVFAGRSPAGTGAGTEKVSGQEIPAGLYLFVQRRRALSLQECIDLAIEQHEDGLWERLGLENRLYIRRLFEDGSEVTQLFRPITE